MTNFPKSLDDWTYETITEIVEQYEYEPGFFDYKAVLNASEGKHREKLNQSIRKTAGAMANTAGGYILFGVEDHAIQVATPLDRTKGIPLDGDLRKQFGDKLRETQPPIHFEAIAKAVLLPNDSSRGIFVVSIPESFRRPHMVNPEGVFYRRDAGGSAVLMDFYQVRDLMMQRRQALLAILQ
jgi:predicted HTH transcriptional regulator